MWRFWTEMCRFGFVRWRVLFVPLCCLFPAVFNSKINHQEIMSQYVKLMGLGAFCGLLAACGSGNDRSHSSSEVVHNVFVVNPIPVGGASSRTFSGVVEENRTIGLGFKTAGQIESILVKEGAHVGAGQLLATLDTKDYALVVKQLQVQYDQLKADHDRLTYLHDHGNVSESEYAKSATGLEQVAVQLQLNKNKLDYTRLTSPISGVVTKVNFEKAEMVDAGRPVFEIMDNGSLEIVVDLPVKDFMERGSFDSIMMTGRDGAQYPLTVLSITPKADNNQLYQMKLGVPANAGANLTAGMNVTVTINKSGADAADRAEYEVPLRSVFERDGASCVWVLKADSTVVARRVDVLGNRDGKVTVSGDINDNEMIVKAGVHSLTDGERVKVINNDSKSNVGNTL